MRKILAILAVCGVLFANGADEAKDAYKRKFDGRAISFEILKVIVKDAQMPPSWANSQPWKVYIATGKTLENIKSEHLKLAQSGSHGLPDLPTTRRAQWDSFTQENMGVWQREFGAFEGVSWERFGELSANLFGASAVAYLCIPKNYSVWSVFDLGAFSQTLMLSAYARGVDSLPAYELVKFPYSVRKIAGIPENLAVAMGVALGYATNSPINKFASSRVDTDKILTIKD